jgi:uncharacterized repeat protein (TIGR01451 family)/fimbrial isopeptide formation D2 family protein
MTTRLVSRRTVFLTIGLAAALALALGLWLGAFQAERASAQGPDLTVTVASTPSSGTWAPGTLVSYTVTVNASGATTSSDGHFPLDIISANAAVEGSVTSPGSTCAVTDTHNIDCEVNDFTGSGAKTVTFTARTEAVGPALVGAFVDPLDGGVGDIDELEAGAASGDDGDDEGAVDCSGVGEGTDADPVEEPDNFDCVSLTVANADLTIVKTVDPLETTVVGQGAVLYYTLTVTNSVSATGIAKDVAIRDTLDSGLNLFSVTPGTGVTCGDITPPILNCTAAQIAPGETRVVQIVATVIPSSGTVLNGAYVDPQNIIGETNDDANDPDLDCTGVGEGTDVDPATEPDNFDCTSHTVGGALDLYITKTASPSTGSGVATGSTITYTLTVTNSGAVTASNVLIRDELGTGLTFVSMAPASGTAGTGVTCTDTVAPFDCTASSIPGGESRSVVVTATVAASSGTVLNGAYVDPLNTIAESNEDADDPNYDCAAVGEGSDVSPATEEDNFECTSHTVGALDLTVTKTASPSDGSSVATGGTIVYTITVSATGAAASNVAIRDTIGTGLSLTSVTPGTNVTCSDTTAPEINCTASSIAAGSSVTVTVATTVTATSGTVLNGARVDPANAISETNDDADDPSLDCSAVGEGTDAGDATEPDNFDCTSHTVGAAANTRTLNLSPAGWHNFVWTGASGTEPGTALSCISGNYTIAYEWVDSLGAFARYVPGSTELSNMDPLTQYDPLLVFITTAGVTCVMPVVS